MSFRSLRRSLRGWMHFGSVPPRLGVAPTTGTLYGVVYGTDGVTPSVGATVAITAGGAGSTTTNSAGVYSLLALSLGTYTLQATSADTLSTVTHAGLIVSAAVETVQNLTLVAVGSIFGIIYLVPDANEDLTSFQDVSITLTPSGGNAPSQNPIDAANIYYTIDNVAAGTYTISVSALNTLGTYTYHGSVAGVVVIGGATTTAATINLT